TIPLKREKSSSLIVGVAESDVKQISAGTLFRLKDFANFTREKENELLASFHSLDVNEVLTAKGPIIHWIPKHGSIPAEITMVDGELVTGWGEPGLSRVDSGTFLQFERVGFARVFDKGDPMRISFAHK
ncbi:MAG: hypothetical protein ACFFAY_13300, partial [Promethearchaeota archaeon]